MAPNYSIVFLAFALAAPVVVLAGDPGIQTDYIVLPPRDANPEPIDHRRVLHAHRLPRRDEHDDNVDAHARFHADPPAMAPPAPAGVPAGLRQPRARPLALSAWKRTWQHDGCISRRVLMFPKRCRTVNSSVPRAGYEAPPSELRLSSAPSWPPDTYDGDPLRVSFCSPELRPSTSSRGTAQRSVEEAEEEGLSSLAIRANRGRTWSPVGE
ncbi:hypothetical protein ACP70R_005823 [Stipagrostis hirtigluma subsp. patula]